MPSNGCANRRRKREPRAAGASRSSKDENWRCPAWAADPGGTTLRMPGEERTDRWPLVSLLEAPDARASWGPPVTVDLSDARDRDLVQRIGRGDGEAFRGLFGRYAPSAMAIARRVVRQPFLAEEIVQEA